MNVLEPNKDPRLGSAAMIASMLIFGTIGIVVKNIRISSVECAFFRALIAIVVIGILRFCKHEGIKIAQIKQQKIKLLLSGTALGCNWILLFQAYQYTSVSIATLCYYLAPVFVLLTTPVLFKERLTKRQVFCFFMILAGFVLTLNVSELTMDGTKFIGILYGIGAAACYALLILLNKKTNGISASDRSLIQFAVSAVVLFLYLILTKSFHLELLDTKGILCLVLLGVVHTAIAYYLYFYAMTKLPVVKIAIYGYLDPVTAILWSILFLQENLNAVQILGAVMILGFTLFHDLTSQHT